jgi:hypothetical protein
MNEQETWIPLSDPDITVAEIEAVSDVLKSPRISSGPKVEEFEAAFAQYIGRRHAIAVGSGTLGVLLVLKAYGIGPGDEVIASPHSFRETTHAITLSGAMPVFADIDYWAGTLAPEKAAEKITDKTRAILVGNTNGHPAPWNEFQELAKANSLRLIEDSTEAIGSVYRGKLVGSFGDCSVFDFSQPGILVCGEGGMVVTDDDDLATAVRRYRGRRQNERTSVVIGNTPPYQSGMGDLAAAVGLAQLNGLERILSRRKRVDDLYYEYISSFEGIKPPYIEESVDEIYWFLYVVHLGTRFSKSSRDAIIDDMKTERVESAAYSQPLHLQPHYFSLGYRKGQYLVTEKVADRAVALPFHGHLTETQIAFIVGTMKDASINIGAGTAIYL